MLAWLYRNLCRASNRNVVAIAGPLQLLQSWIFWRFPSLRPYGFDQFSWPVASRWARYLPTSNERDPRVFQFRTMLDRMTHRDVWLVYLLGFFVYSCCALLSMFN
ncbi:hypothetical protein PIB30_111314 [Stylosanthes scabra]|uniref:Aminotransferase-like plant mobile domain-containing protein n=1 Tax=Stylosanthes scabra TaxID=79078 RepID=A0ABU6R128_9FABA|nr:hypothetical protein [Stylosanthes scabra]